MNNKFYDYKTAPVTDTELIDPTKTGMSFYDDFLDTSKATVDYLVKKHNMIGNIVMMSPEEYYQACSDYGYPDSHPSVDALKADRRYDKNTLQHLHDVLTVYKKRFPVPVLNKAQHAQEGLHRMMVVGDILGWDHKVPVLVIDWADKELAAKHQKLEQQAKIQNRIEHAVNDALRYKFSDIEDFKNQLQWELDSYFDTDNTEFDLMEQDDVFIVTVKDVPYEFSKDSVDFVSTDTFDSEQDFTIDEDEIEDFLVRYIGADWRTTHPHLKKTFNMNEELDTTLTEIDSIIRAEFEHSNSSVGPCFITPEGTFINIYPKLDDHEDLCYWLEDRGINNIVEDGEWFVNTLNYVRCRDSLHMSFIQLPKICTSKQYDAILEWLENQLHSDQLELMTPSEEYKEYDLNDYFPEDILNLIKRYYSSGKLYETLI